MRTKLSVPLRKPIAFGLATALAGIGLSVPASASADAPSDLVATGVVQRQDDAAMATIGKGNLRGVGHATVRLMWDGQPEPHANGAKGTAAVVARATADASGRYAVHVTPTAAMLSAAASNDGWVNFTLIITTPEGDFQITSLSRALVNGAWSDKGRAEFAPGRAVTTTFAYDRRGSLLQGARAPATTGAQSAANGETQNGIDACIYFVRATYNQSTRIGNFHNTVGITGSWTYGASADSDIDVGIQYPGQNWSISGSKHVGNSGGAWQKHSTTQSYDKYIRTNFFYEKREWACEECGCWWYEMEAIRWTGGAQDDGNTYLNCHNWPMSKYQDYRPAGSQLHVFSSRAQRIGFAIDVAGVRLGQTSGYSTRVEFDWIVGNSGRLFCGYSDWPVGQSPGPGVIYNQVG